MFVAQQNQYLCTSHMSVMMLLGSRVGRSQFENHKKVLCETLLYTTFDELLEGNAPLPSVPMRLKRRGFGGAAPKKFLKFHPLLWL